MKKFLVVFAVLALTMAMASVAMAEITFDGSVEFLMRSLKNTSDWNDDQTSGGDYKQTYERVRFGINAKHENVKARVQIENDWDVWGRVESPMANGNLGCDDLNANGVCDAGETDLNTAIAGEQVGRLTIREAWLDFNLPWGIPGHIKVGHQFLQLGNGWFFRANKYGSDAWVIGFPGKNTIAFVDVKASEGSSFRADDTDAYVLLDTYKIDDKNSVGAYLVHYKERGSVSAEDVTLNNIGLHYNGVIGPINLAAEVDFQTGEVEPAGGTSTDLSGNQVVVQASMNMDALTLRATAAMGSGDDNGLTDNEFEQFQNILDKDPHFTLVYEYFMTTAAGGKNTGFSNTTALGIGADFKATNMVTVGADIWLLQATEDVSIRGAAPDSELGNEIDVKVNLKLYDQLTWNTTIGYFMPGKAYENAAGDADNVQAIQSVLSYKF